MPYWIQSEGGTAKLLIVKDGANGTERTKVGRVKNNGGRRAKACIRNRDPAGGEFLHHSMYFMGWR